MLWTWPTTRYGNTWSEMDRLQREVNRLFEPFSRAGTAANESFPAVNIWTGEDKALLTAEIPGVAPDKVEVTVKDNTVTVRGSRDSEALKEGETYLRQERGAGVFVRSFTLPFHVDAAKVTADYRMGVLQLTLPRREEDRPRKITVNAG
jgi:HSP20 family protein